MATVLDAYALVTALRGEVGAREVELILRRDEALIGAVNLAEAVDRLTRLDRVEEAPIRAGVESLVVGGLIVVPLSEAHGWRAGTLRARHYRRRRSEVSMADCCALSLALDGHRIATADPALARAARDERVDVVALPDSRGRRP